MPRTGGQKLKLLYIYKLLYENSDEEHVLSTTDLIGMLANFGITAERKSVYDDIEALISFGVDIVTVKGQNAGYYIGQRVFELPELMLLADAVASSRFITEKKSAELIGKITSLTDKWHAGKINRQIYTLSRTKNPNEQIYYNIDRISEAISRNRQITFKYFEYNTDKQVVYRRGGSRYTASPYALYWDDEFYYMIAYYGRYGKIVNFRADKMEKIEILEEPRIGEARKEGFDPAAYAKTLFSMFAGETERVKLEFSNQLIGVALDRFGYDISVEKRGDDRFAIVVDVAVSPTFLGWLFQFGDNVRILSPESLIRRMKNEAEKVYKQYQGNDEVRL
jgi:predicted DNA-binding transcriptional regulator YafY